MKHIEVKVSLETPDDLLPVYATQEAAGADLRAAEDGCLSSGEYRLVPTGLKLEIPIGYEVQVRPRSGLAAKHGVTLLNSPGTIDSDYRGEIKVILINHGKETFHYKRGDRIAQMVVAECVRCLFKKDNLSDSLRSEGGFGHSGVK